MACLICGSDAAAFIHGECPDTCPRAAEHHAFVPDPSCPDCGGQGVGCCVNADIPLPGVER